MLYEEIEEATRSDDQTLDHPRVLLLRTQVATDSAPWLTTELYLTQVKKGRWGRNAEPARPLPPLFTEVLPHACAVCARSALIGATMQRCGRCKVARYCSAHCAKLHWPQHKAVCAELMQAPVPVTGKDYEVPLTPAAAYFHRRRARCCVCQDASAKLSLCGRCKGLAYCAKCVEKHPAAECDAAILEQCCLGLVSDMGAPLTLASRSPLRGPRPGGWKAYFEEKLWDFEAEAGLLALGPPMAMLTEALSLPIALATYLPAKASVAHVVGCLPVDLVGVQRFREVFGWRPELRRLAVCLVGHGLRDCTEKQPPAEGDDRLLVLEVRGGPYGAAALPPADLVVLLGFDAAAAEVALARGRAMVVLAATRAAADEAYAFFSTRAERTAAPRENPFRGLRPQRAAAPATGFVYANHWVVEVGAAARAA